MRRFFYSLIIGLSLSLSAASIAMADTYEIGVIVDGQTLTITVITSNESVTATVDSPSMKIVSATKVTDSALAVHVTDEAKQPESTVIVVHDANLRSGPGTSFPVVGRAKAGDEIDLVSVNETGDWYQLDDSKWIAAFLISGDTSSIQVQLDSSISTGLSPDAEQDERAAVIEYYALAKTFAGRYATGLSKSGELFIQLLESPQLRFDSDWKDKIITYLSLITDTGKQIRAIIVPPFLQPVHDSFLAAAKHFDDSVEISIKGMVIADGKALDEAMSEMVAGSEDVKEAGRLLSDLKKRYGIE